jgi:hypothetical protein
MYPNNNCNDCPPCPGTITPPPLPDLSGLCGNEYDAACVIYTGPNITCLGIESGMNFLEILNIFNSILPGCNCCEQIVQNCVVGPWSNWSSCECYYNDDDELICGQETRTRNIITPPLNGGTPCPPLIETRPCTINQVCFTIGSDACETAPNATQLLLSPAGLYNDKPYYELFVCTTEEPPLYIWFNNVTNLWYQSSILGTAFPGSQSLDNNNNYLPISNNNDQTWTSCETCDLYLITSQSSSCPNVKICFQYTILIYDSGGDNPQAFTYYTYVAPAYLGEGGFPVYQWSINTPDGVYNMEVSYDTEWVHIIQDPLGDYSNQYILLTNTFFPISTSTVQWTGSEAAISVMQASTLGGPCVQPPNVPCVLNCGPWSECIAGTRTRTCTVTTPPSGNVPPCPPLIQTEQCSVPSCFPPSAVVVTQNGSSVIISFTGVSGAANYEITYTVNGGSPLTVIGTSSPITLPYVCDAEYEGTIVTNCTNLLTSSSVSWGPITTDVCGSCVSDPPRSMIGGNLIIAPVGNTIPLDGSGDTSNVLPNLIFNAAAAITPIIYDIVLTPSGYVYAGSFSSVSSTGFSQVSGLGNIVMINCNFTPNTLFFGSGFTVGLVAARVNTVVYDQNTNRLYIGGNFTSYKGVLCTPGIVVLNASTGNIDTSFATSTAGAIDSNGAMDVHTIAIQSDGKIVVGGKFTSMYGNNNCKYLCRFTSAGVIDTTLNVGTSFISTSAPLSTRIYKVLLTPTNEIFVGGVFTEYNGVLRNYIVKLSTTGSLITSFNPGTLSTQLGSGLTLVKDIAYQGTQLLVGGTFSSFNGGSTPGSFARINANTAAFDNSFNLYTPLGAVKSVAKILVQNNKIYIGTSYTGYGSSTKHLYYVLNSNGTIAFTTTVNITASGSQARIYSILLLP